MAGASLGESLLMVGLWTDFPMHRHGQVPGLPRRPASLAEGRVRYYSAGQGPRQWYEVDTYCCPGNYCRIIGELPDLIARPHHGGISIDL
jgi:hypothetical protein